MFRPSRRALIGLFSLLAIGVSAPGRAGTDKCQQGIEKASTKLEGKVLKALQKCTDFYRKGLAKHTPVADAAGNCQQQLERTVKFPDTVIPGSSMATTKDALDFLVAGGTCNDSDLRTLGHLPTALFGDTWSRSIVIAKLGAAYELQLQTTRDTAAVFRTLAAAGGCSLCASLGKPPCTRHDCRLGSGPSTAQLYTSAGGPLATLTLTGQVAFDLCRADNVLPGDLVVVGGPSKTVKQGSVLGATACVSVGRIAGYVTCGAAAPRIQTGSCDDHMVGPTPEVDDCAVFGSSCTPVRDDLVDGDPSGASNTHDGTSNGGSCVILSAASAAAGDAFMQAAVQITLVHPGELGPDGVACTPDDTARPGTTSTVGLTTSTALSLVFDANNTPGIDFSAPLLTGTRFGCTNLQAGTLSPGKLVGAVGALHDLCLTPPCDDPATAADEGTIPLDSLTAYTLSCQ